MKPIIINHPESMLKVRVMTVKDYSELALKTLHKVGVLHVEQGEELKPVDRTAIESERGKVSELLDFVDNVLSYVPQKERVSLGKDVEVIYTRPFSEIGGEVRSLYSKVNKLYERTVKINDEVQRLTETKGYLESLGEQTAFRLKDLNFSGDYIFSRVFILPAKTYEALYNRLKDHLLGSTIASVETETILYAVAKVRGRESTESMVTDAGGKILPVPDEDLTLSEFIEMTDGKIHNLEEELAGLRQELQSKACEDLNRLALLREALSAENERLSVLEKACEAKYVMLLEGWIPESSIESAISEIKESIGYVFMDTRKPGTSEEPPTKLRNARGLKPFEVIVNLFGTPKYREWDPTPIIAYSFAFFFGLMICDVVYAVGIILFTRFLLSKLVDDPESENYRLFQRILYISGCIALVVGLLSGNYLGDIYAFFGVESLALVEGVRQTLQSPVSFIVLAIAIGFVHVNIAHMLALIKGLKEKQAGVVLGKIGMFAIQIFGIPIIMNAMLGVNIPLLDWSAASIFMIATLASVIVIIIGAIVESRGMGMILWIFNITGILGDVMSYCSLAGVGLATFYLASSFNMLASIFRSMLPGVVGLILGGILAIGVLFIGHVINLLMSTITGFIHSLRLCFVEFLFKFYEGGGRIYSPFKLRARSSLVVGEKG